MYYSPDKRELSETLEKERRHIVHSARNSFNTKPMTGGEIPVDFGTHSELGRAPVNVIPDGTPSPCHDTLVVRIGMLDGWSVPEARIREALKHVSIKCPLQRYVVFKVQWWDGLAWAKYASAFKTRGITCILRMPGQPDLMLT